MGKLLGISMSCLFFMGHVINFQNSLMLSLICVNWDWLLHELYFELSQINTLLVVTFHVSSGGGGVLSPKSYVDVPAGPRKSDFLNTNFLLNFPSINIPFLKEKHPILIKLGAFYDNLPKIHPIYVIWAPSSLMKTPDRYTEFRENAPQKAGTYTSTMSM